MNDLPPFFKYPGVAIVLVISIIILSCAGQKTQGTGGSKVSIRGGGILIRPGTKLSESDQKAMNDILRNYDKSLYKIQTYENGQLKKTRGNLRNIYIDKATASTAAKTMAETGSTQYVLQIGFLDKTHRAPRSAEVVGFTDKTHQSPTPPPQDDVDRTDKTHQSPTPPSRDDVDSTDKTHQSPTPPPRDDVDSTNKTHQSPTPSRSKGSQKNWSND